MHELSWKIFEAMSQIEPEDNAFNFKVTSKQSSTGVFATYDRSVSAWTKGKDQQSSFNSIATNFWSTQISC